MNTQERQKLVEHYRAGAEAVVKVIEGLDESSLDARPGEGEWTPREIIHHLADSEMTSAIRLRRLLAEEAPQISGYDEEEFVRRLHYDRPIEHSLAAMKAARDTSAEILERLTEEEWKRAGTHSERGFYSVERWLEFCAPHAHDHADQLRRAIAAGSKS
jgi:hypothetical protein